MTNTRSCPRCHATLAPNESPQGLCPKCLLAVAMGAPEEIRTHSGRPAEEPPTLDVIGALFPQLDVLEIVGRGGMGVVYRVRQQELDRIVALKILPIRAGADPAFEERFVREARALASLAHENIVSVYDSGRAGDFYYILMEFVDGPNLRQMIRSSDIRPAQALALVSQVCSALEFAHGEGIVHRDIKPENILIDQRGRVKIADFGLAKLLDPGQKPDYLTRADQAMGTPQYMAPEQMERPLEVDHRADIYSLGVVLYELLTGELPLGRFSAPSGKVAIDVRLDEVVLRTLEKEPERRYQHAIDVKTDVDAITHSASTAPFVSSTASAHESAPDREFHGVHAKGSAPWRRALGCCGLLVLGGLGLLLFGFLFLAGSNVTPGTQSVGKNIDTGAGPIESSGPSASVTTTDEEPPWSAFESLLVDDLGLDADGRELARLIAFSRYDQYLRLEGDHTTVSNGSNGSRTDEIEPFPEELEILEQGLLDDLASVVDGDLHSELRSRIDLEELFPFGRDATTVQIRSIRGGAQIQITVGGERWLEADHPAYPRVARRFLEGKGRPHRPEASVSAGTTSEGDASGPTFRIGLMGIAVVLVVVLAVAFIWLVIVLRRASARRS